MRIYYVAGSSAQAEGGLRTKFKKQSFERIPTCGGFNFVCYDLCFIRHHANRVSSNAGYVCLPARVMAVQCFHHDSTFLISRMTFKSNLPKQCTILIRRICNNKAAGQTVENVHAPHNLCLAASSRHRNDSDLFG